MDIFSHGLWAVAAAKGAVIKTKKKLSLKFAFFFGVFPDLFTFTWVFLWIFWQRIFGGVDFDNFRNGVEPAQVDTLPIFELTNLLYNLSHSLLVFFIVAFLIFFVFKKRVWEMGGWLLHILMDIPTHSYAFYPTPFLWPLSDWKFDGFSWGQPWFLVLNYSLLAVLYIFLFYKYRNRT